MLAYAFLIITIILGFPDIYSWGMAPAPVVLCYGSLIWQCACLAFQVRPSRCSFVLTVPAIHL